MRKLIVYTLFTLLCLTFSMHIETIKVYSTERIRVNVGFKGEPDPLLIEAYGGGIIYDFTGFIPVITCYLTLEAIDVLKQLPDIEYILVDGEVRMTGEVLPWGVERVRANLVWDTDGDRVVDDEANAGAGVTVAVLDTGIDYDHPDLKDNVIGGKSCVDYTSNYMDDNGHGTHVAGTIAAVDNDIGVMGVAPRVWLYGVKVLRSGGGGYISDLVAGIQWSILQGADIISMSLSYPDDDPTLSQAIVDAYNVGVLLVASAGDVSWYGDIITYPAKYEEVIAVGSVDKSNLRDERFSPTGPELELVAPGVDINSTYWDVHTSTHTYEVLSGTSFAVPHVSGVAALTFASRVNPMYDDWDGKWDNDEVRERLKDLAQDLGPPEEYGYGLVDAILRDTAVTFATSYKTVLGEGYTLEIYATIENLGSPPETIDTEANVWDDGNIHFNETKTIYLTAENSTTTLTFLWDTNQTESPKGLYSIEIYVSEPPGDIYPYNNEAYPDPVTVTIPGDINGDYTVGLADSIILSAHYTHSKSFESPGHVPEDWNADINGDCSVGLADAIILSTHYGETDP